MDSHQPELTLYHFPNACSQVVVCALEAAGLAYALELVDLASGQQTSPAYLAVNPLGKVPLLLVDGTALAETAAILTFIALTRPDAGLIPVTGDLRLRAEAVGGMAFVGGTLHPVVRGIANPQRMTTGETGPVREKSVQLADKAFALAERRLATTGWWLGEWSIIDVYLNWAFGVARRAGYETAAFPTLESLADRLEGRPGFDRMLQVNAGARTTLGI